MQTQRNGRLRTILYWFKLDHVRQCIILRNILARFSCIWLGLVWSFFGGFVILVFTVKMIIAWRGSGTEHCVWACKLNAFYLRVFILNLYPETISAIFRINFNLILSFRAFATSLCHHLQCFIIIFFDSSYWLEKNPINFMSLICVLNRAMLERNTAYHLSDSCLLTLHWLLSTFP